MYSPKENNGLLRLAIKYYGTASSHALQIEMKTQVRQLAMWPLEVHPDVNQTSPALSHAFSLGQHDRARSMTGPLAGRTITKTSIPVTSTADQMLPATF